ncbi:MAG: VOC family protein [Bacteroidetes bacterium]|nr:MAG: VOC family protein [Bacteroidota bacterium]
MQYDSSGNNLKLHSIAPKLPMRDPQNTKAYYVDQFQFKVLGDYGDYLLLGKDDIEIHFFLHPDLNPSLNYGQVYIRVSEIEKLYAALIQAKVTIHPNGELGTRPWGQKEFSLLDPDSNLLTFGETTD